MASESISRKLLREAALARGWQVSYLGAQNYMMTLTDPRTGMRELFLGTRPLRSSANGRAVALDKRLSLDFVSSLGIRVPAYQLYDPATAETFLAQHTSIVVKPLDSERSQGVSVEVSTMDQICAAVSQAKQFSSDVLLQEMLHGKLYRLFVLDGRLVAAAERRAARVVGDGRQTIAALIATLNQDPMRSGPDAMLKPIQPAAVTKFLGPDALTRVSANGEVVKLAAIDSISAGGDVVEVLNIVHPDIRERAEQLASALRLFVCGFDIICDDIAAAPAPDYFPLLEINSMPGLRLHYASGISDLAEQILDALLAHEVKTD